MFKNLKLAIKLALGFGLVILVTIVVALQGIRGMTLAKKMLHSIYDNNLISIRNIANANMQAIYHNRNLYDFVLEEDKDEMKKIADNMEKNVVGMNEFLNKYRQTNLTKEEKELLTKVDAAWSAYLEAAKKAVALSYEGKDATKIIKGPATKNFQMVNDHLRDLANLNDSLAKKAYDDSDVVAANMTKQSIGMLVAGIMISVFFGCLITLSITHPMDEAIKVAQTVASGNLSSRIEVKSKDETGQLLQALKNMNDSLARIVGEVRGGTHTIASASQQIASGNADLSSRTEEQADSLKETASSMEELTSIVKQNADNAQQANQLAHTASEVAVKGGAVVSEVVVNMGAINESAKKIIDIIGVIDGIAFQTNILALNAAVEAARAGEQGRGFAIVASEVRSLAQRSAQAAKEIKALIDNSVEKVDAGSKLVNQAGTTMQEVVESIRRVTDIMVEISAAIQEQTADIEHVNQAITQMDRMTQQNAVLVQESAAASGAMQEQANKLAQVVSVFRLS